MFRERIMIMTLRSLKVTLLLLSVLSVLLSGCVRAPSELLLQSVDTDQQLGMEVARQVKQEMGIIDDPDRAPYLKAVGQRLVSQISDRRFDYSFRIVDQPEPNAFAAPGGYVYVSRGLLALTNSEDELANVIGHEIIHVGRRHTAKQLARQRVPGLLSLPGRVVGRVVSTDLGRLVNLPVATVGTTFLATYSRHHESEADQLGQQLSGRAGYDPVALALFLDRLEQEDNLRTGSQRKFSFFASHPMTPQRVSETNELAATIKWTSQPGIAVDQTEFLRHLDGLLLGANPANGVFQGKKFMHPDFDFFIEFPKDWKTQNSRQAVGAISPKRDGLVFLGVMGVGDDPEAVALAFSEALGKEFGIRSSRSEPVKIGAWPGYLVTYTDKTGKEPMYMHFLWVASRGLIYQMIGLCPEYHRETLRDTALSFRALTKKERSSIQETRLRIVSAEAGEDLIRLSERTHNVWDPKTTAVMNGIAPGQPLKKGQRIKIAVEQGYKSPKTGD
jgi:predicted Zn-dependent protease